MFYRQHLLVIPLLLAANCAGRPASSALPRVPLKLSDPKTAAMTFTEAIASGDLATARAASLGTDRQQQWLIATTTMVRGLRSFDIALTRRFGPDAAATHMDIVNALNPLSAGAVDSIRNAHVEIDGREATLKAAAKIYARDMVHASLLREVKKDVWKVDLPRLLEENPALAAENNSPDLARTRKVGNVMNEMAGEVAANRYHSLEEAEAALDEKLAAAAP